MKKSQVTAGTTIQHRQGTFPLLRYKDSNLFSTTSMNGQNITAMEAKDIEKLVRKAKDDIEKEVRDRLPRKVGITAVNHFRQNFRDAGWRDNGLHPWKKTRRQQGGEPDAKYTPLTSRRDHLMRYLQYEQRGHRHIPVPYAASRKEIFRNK